MLEKAEKDSRKKNIHILVLANTCKGNLIECLLSCVLTDSFPVCFDIRENCAELLC